MNDKVAIITDSCADLSREYVEEYHIFEIPLLIQSDDHTYRDLLEIDVEQVYELQKTKALKSASPLGSDIIGIFNKVRDEGYTHAIVLTISSGLSGTYNAVRLAALSYEDLEIQVYDSQSGSIGYGAIAMMLSKYSQNGLNFEELKGKTEQLIRNTHIFFSLDTLTYLEKGGRIGKASALVGNTFKIHPILSIDRNDGQIYVIKKVRGSKKMISKLIECVDEAAKNYPNDQPFNIMIADGALRDQRDKLEIQIRKKYPNFQKFITATIGTTLSVYVGPGLLGAAIQFL